MLLTSWTTQRSTDEGSDLLKIVPESTVDLDLAAAAAQDLAADAERAVLAAALGGLVAAPVGHGLTVIPEAVLVASQGQDQSQAAKTENQNHRTRRRVTSKKHPSLDLVLDQHLDLNRDLNRDLDQNQDQEHLMIGVNQMLHQRQMEMLR